MSLVVPSLRGIVASAPWAKNELWRKAQAVPTLDLRFADSKSLTDAVSGQNLITFTRASSGTYVGSDGLIKTALANAPRFDHNPVTGESLGLLIEEQRTNSIRNNTMVGAVAGTPGTVPTNWSVGTAGGLSVNVVGVGVENGVNCVDIRVYGTTTNTNLALNCSFDTATATPALNGQTWTLSSYVKLVAGSLAGITNLRHYIIPTDGVNALAYLGSGELSPGSTLTRRVHTVTIASAGAANVAGAIWINHAGIGTAIDFTLRIGLPQLEQGAFATSVIPTTTATVTRNADVASITGSNFSSWYRQDEGTVFAEGDSNTSTPGPFLVTRVATSGDRHQVTLGGSATVNAGAVQANLVVGYTTGQRKVAYGYADNDIALAVSTGDLLTDSVATIPTNLTYATLGRFDFGGLQSLNGHCRRLTFFNRRLPNATLESITKP